jgi:hypothetical protein
VTYSQIKTGYPQINVDYSQIKASYPQIKIVVSPNEMDNPQISAVFPHKKVDESWENRFIHKKDIPYPQKGDKNGWKSTISTK